jgi:hypothetical protein
MFRSWSTHTDVAALIAPYVESPPRDPARSLLEKAEPNRLTRRAQRTGFHETLQILQAMHPAINLHSLPEKARHYTVVNRIKKERMNGSKDKKQTTKAAHGETGEPESQAFVQPEDLK